MVATESDELVREDIIRDLSPHQRATSQTMLVLEKLIFGLQGKQFPWSHEPKSMSTAGVAIEVRWIPYWAITPKQVAAAAQQVFDAVDIATRREDGPRSRNFEKALGKQDAGDFMRIAHAGLGEYLRTPGSILMLCPIRKDRQAMLDWLAKLHNLAARGEYYLPNLKTT